jgi:branched-chain amino acid aminotransferase
MTATHAFADDARNATVLIDVNGDLLPRAEAKISVFDAGFILGDGVWEGVRLHNGKLAFLQAHFDRLWEGAKAIDLDIGLSREALSERILRVCRANAMTGGVHIRLMVTRGLKTTPYQHPRATLPPATIVIIAEWKQAAEGPKHAGVTLFTAHVRRGPPDVQDPRINSHSKLNCILACIQADKAGADEALMLDPHGFVATCNSTHFFIVRRGELWTSTGKYCLHGITRANILRLAVENGVPAFQKNFSLTDVYAADEAFVTGTFGGVTPAVKVDGRVIGSGERGPLTERLQRLYGELIERECPSA